MMQTNIEIAKQLIIDADAVLITAGAGMGVDSGLPDFRGNEGFWEAYPPMRELGLNFEKLANPYMFESNPALAWGFYGHRLNLYRDTTPHDGFQLLLDLVKEKNENYFIYTSNVDGQFQKAGFDPKKIVEVHGSIHHTQCLENCKGITKADKINVEIDSDKFRALSVPLCEECGSLLRPNILMFSDLNWDYSRTCAQEIRHVNWLKKLKQTEKKLVIIEIGAGKDIPTIRLKNYLVAKKLNADIIRINPRDYEMHSSMGVGLECGGLAGLKNILQNKN